MRTFNIGIGLYNSGGQEVPQSAFRKLEMQESKVYFSLSLKALELRTMSEDRRR